MIGRPQSTFNEYLVGSKVYNGGSNAPTRGPVDKLGYRERDAKTRAKRNAMLRRLKAQNSGKFMNSDWLRGPNA